MPPNGEDFAVILQSSATRKPTDSRVRGLCGIKERRPSGPRSNRRLTSACQSSVTHRINILSFVVLLEKVKRVGISVYDIKLAGTTATMSLTRTAAPPIETATSTTTTPKLQVKCSGTPCRHMAPDVGTRLPPRPGGLVVNL